MESFVDILRKYEHQSCFSGTDKNTVHSYGPVYETIFKPYRDSATNILEIGIAGGYALEAYRDYFSKANIYGLDIADKVNSRAKGKDRIHIKIGDALTPEVINYFGVTYDIIIEDASHSPNHQIQHFADFSKLLKPGGIYIMEDLNQIHFERVKNETAKIAEDNGLKQVIYDLRPTKKRFDDILLVFSK